ncbi:MAG: lipopolysaccharide biosynthesis protein, partial [Bacteroidaceae bacterium]|nr:lipopolysaccharide biosynthesis protein [Bacteroidaceae bacterium]
FVAMLLSYIVGQRRNPICYNLKEIGTYVLIAALLYGISYIIPIENTWGKIAFNTLLMIVYLAYFIKKDLPLKQIPFVNRFFK